MKKYNNLKFVLYGLPGLDIKLFNEDWRHRTGYGSFMWVEFGDTVDKYDHMIFKDRDDTCCIPVCLIVDGGGLYLSEHGWCSPDFIFAAALALAGNANVPIKLCRSTLLRKPTAKKSRPYEIQIMLIDPD